MQPFTVVAGPAAPLLVPNINTDLLAPGRRADRPVTPMTQRTLTENLAEYLFAQWRYDKNGEIADFVLNRPPFRGARILLAGPNFGCGSSRETAVWALLEFGIRCVVAPSFGTIFHGNAFKNGLLPVSLPIDTVQRLAAKAEVDGKARPLSVSLVDQAIRTDDGEVVPFTVPEFRRRPLLEGVDDIDVTLSGAARIREYQRADRASRPWAYAVESVR